MPIWLRRLTFQTIKEYFENQNKKNEAANKSSKPSGPAIRPSYTTKASK